MKRFQRVLACTDFSEVGNRAIEMAFGLVRGEGERLLLVHVMDPPAVPNPMYAHYVSPEEWDPKAFQDASNKAVEALRALVPGEAKGLSLQIDTAVPQGNPAEELLRLSEEEDVEIVVMGTHGRTGLERFLLGSVTERVVRTAGCAVMVVH